MIIDSLRNIKFWKLLDLSFEEENISLRTYF